MNAISYAFNRLTDNVINIENDVISLEELQPKIVSKVNQHTSDLREHDQRIEQIETKQIDLDAQQQHTNQAVSQLFKNQVSVCALTRRRLRSHDCTFGSQETMVSSMFERLSPDARTALLKLTYADANINIGEVIKNQISLSVPIGTISLGLLNGVYNDVQERMTQE
jgi:hypothetical protein